MATKKELAEKLEVARLAAHASDIAASNIRRYLEIHAESAAVVNRVMKIADELTEEMQKVIEASADLAAKSLKKFTGNK